MTPPRREGGGQRSELIESRHDLGETEEDEDKYTGEREWRQEERAKSFGLLVSLVNKIRESARQPSSLSLFFLPW